MQQILFSCLEICNLLPSLPLYSFFCCIFPPLSYHIPLTTINVFLLPSGISHSSFPFLTASDMLLFSSPLIPLLYVLWYILLPGDFTVPSFSAFSSFPYLTSTDMPPFSILSSFPFHTSIGIPPFSVLPSFPYRTSIDLLPFSDPSLIPQTCSYYSLFCLFYLSFSP